MKHHGSSNWPALFSALTSRRKPNTDAIADMALENFVEMRDTTADPKFQLKKQVGFELEKRFDGRFIPRYSMVMFHPEITYAQAQALSKKQEILLETLCANASSVKDINWDEAETLIQELST